jgi:hypothetical protein
MDRATAQARLTLFGETATEPVISAPEQGTLLDMAKRVDKYGVWPTDAGWTETYNANTAIALCWLLKSSRLAPRYLFMSGGKMFSRQQFYDHCMKQYKIYAMKAGISAQKLSAAALGLGVVPNNWNP